VKSFEEFMAGAMRRQPTDIIIGECRKPEHMIEDAMTSCAQALRLVINQRLVPSTDGKWTPLRDVHISGHLLPS
jgi:defect in organelle trafficking protein DotB